MPKNGNEIKMELISTWAARRMREPPHGGPICTRVSRAAHSPRSELIDVYGNRFPVPTQFDYFRLFHYFIVLFYRVNRTNSYFFLAALFYGSIENFDNLLAADSLLLLLLRAIHLANGVQVARFEMPDSDSSYSAFDGRFSRRNVCMQ